ncbi:uncharacterized protein LOC119111687 [Pollicipes pollicipes]|uniref:uncharacterized protein LOC119111687 n=1 Tax=Pollicipes pollicipes TaxID=41117 RepID=UPI001884D320|nr:uncharacterized protein LOC119111687 [Pollicipes pollicipes]
MRARAAAAAALLTACTLVREASGHGRLMDPPARNSLWRFGFPGSVNYNDNELYCGGFVVQYEQNGGKCGVCGDNYAQSEPRPHEAGGEFAKGVITKRYAPGQIIDIEVELTANHKGNFVIRLCPHNNDKKTVTQECLNKHVLRVAGTNSIRFIIPDDSKKSETFRWKVELPPYLTCNQCVMQWTYYAGNTWGTCSNGEEAVGCGPQETFINCADVAIISNSGFFGPVDNSLKLNLPYTKADVARVTGDQSDRSERPSELAFRAQVCIPHGQFAQLPEASARCIQCLADPAACPTDKCMCISECEAIGEFALRPEAGLYCHEHCLGYPSHCPEDRCKCT